MARPVQMLENAAKRLEIRVVLAAAPITYCATHQKKLHLNSCDLSLSSVTYPEQGRQGHKEVSSPTENRIDSSLIHGELWNNIYSLFPF